MSRGKIVVLLMFGTALAMGGYAWWHQYRGGRKCAEFWGSRAMVAVRYAPRTEFFTLTPADRAEKQGTQKQGSQTSTANGSTSTQDPPSVIVDGKEFVAGRPIDISRAPGLIHARHVLVDDSSFIWNATGNDCQPDWDFALRFVENAEQVTVLFDTRCGWIQWLEQDRRAKLIPSLTEAFRKKQKDWK